jgi:hypothetical protein
VLNILIAILGDSYDNVMNEQVAIDMRQKIELLIELNNYMKIWNARTGTTSTSHYIMLIRYLSN